MSSKTSLRVLVEECVDAVQGLKRCHDAHDARGCYSHAKRIASSSAAISARLQGFDDEELALWVAAVDRAVQNGKVDHGS